MIGRWFSGVSIGLLCISPIPVHAQVVFDGVPTVKVVSTDAGTERHVLSKKERMEFRVTIIGRDGHYYWATRENLELMHHGSGAGHFFIGPKGSGYIKVFDTQSLPDGMRKLGPRFWYMEHLVMPGTLGTITYWGGSDEFRLLGADLVIPVAGRRGHSWRGRDSNDPNRKPPSWAPQSLHRLSL